MASWYDPKVLAQLVAGGKLDNNTINQLAMSGGPQSGYKWSSGDPFNTAGNQMGSGADAMDAWFASHPNGYQQSAQDVLGGFTSPTGQTLGAIDPSQFGDSSGKYKYFQDTYDTPGGSSHDKSLVTYKFDPTTGQATPVSGTGNYQQGWWTDWGRPLAEMAAVVGTAGAAGAYGAGALGGQAAVGTGGGLSSADTAALFGNAGYGEATGSGLTTAGSTGSTAGLGTGWGGSAAAQAGQYAADSGALAGSAPAYGGVGTAGAGAGTDAIVNGSAVAGGGSGGLFGTGFTGQQVAGGAASAGSALDSANTGSDAHFYQNQAGGTGVQDLGNMGGTGTAQIPSSVLNSPGFTDALKAGGSALQQWLSSNPSAVAGLFTSLAGTLGGSSNLNMPNFGDAAQSQQRSGMTNQYTPWGSSTYQQTGVDAQGHPIYSQTTSLNAQGQQNLDAAQKAQGTAIGNIYGNSADQQSAIQQAQQASYAKATGMLDPQWAQSKTALDAQLANQGIGLGSEAYNNAQTNYNNAKTTAYGQAQDQAILTGNNMQNQLFGQNLQAANGLGTSVGNPSFSQQPAAANYLGAAGLTGQGNINQYNAKTGNQNSMTNGLFNLGGSLLGNQNFTGTMGSIFGNMFGSGSTSGG